MISSFHNTLCYSFIKCSNILLKSRPTRYRGFSVYKCDIAINCDSSEINPSIQAFVRKHRVLYDASFEVKVFFFFVVSSIKGFLFQKSILCSSQGHVFLGKNSLSHLVSQHKSTSRMASSSIAVSLSFFRCSESFVNTFESSI